MIFSLFKCLDACRVLVCKFIKMSYLIAVKLVIIDLEFARVLARSPVDMLVPS